ncbi:MAG: histidine kinase [Eubacteriales bacterium]|nr:histidine kinase [Eubacteriales bacterium]
MAIQITDWGQIVWLDEEQDIFSIRGLKAGIVTLAAEAHQPRHRHYEEQVIYVIEGQALSILDGVESRLSAGSFFHWKAGVEHEIYNVGQKPFRHLLISNPEAEIPEETAFRKEGVHQEVSPELIYVAVEAIRTQFLETLHYGYAIFDSFGNLILQSQFYPDYCTACCQPAQNPGTCGCMRRIPLKECSGEKVFYCENGMEVFQYPILFGGTFMGYIQSGYIRHSSSQKGRIEDVYDSPESVVAGIKALIRRIVKAIRNYCEFEQFRRELMEKELHISTQEEAQRILLKNLKDTQSAMTDLKINNHFLFNTLNSMASMALDEGSMPLYQSIVDLSKMFHYTLRTQASMVPLEKEIDYVKAYLQLQKLRYGEELEISWHVDRGAVQITVPFNFLQPVVENAFVHGFEESVHKKIRIFVEKTDHDVEIRVVNSGIKLSEQKCKMINQGIKSNTSHGLSMLYQKLNAIYGKDFRFEIGTDRRKNTLFLICIPTSDSYKAEGDVV